MIEMHLISIKDLLQKILVENIIVDIYIVSLDANGIMYKLDSYKELFSIDWDKYDIYFHEKEKIEIPIDKVVIAPVPVAPIDNFPKVTDVTVDQNGDIKINPAISNDIETQSNITTQPVVEPALEKKSRNISKSKIAALSKEELEDLYINQNKTLTELADMFDCTQPTVSAYLNKYNIKKKRKPANKESETSTSDSSM